MKPWIVGAIVVGAIILGSLGVLWSTGSPTTPTAQLYTPVNAGAAQTLIVTLNEGIYSTTAPNSIWQLGGHFTYSVVEKTSLGQTYAIANAATIAPTIASSSGNYYQLAASINIATTAACAGSNCPGVVENITVTVSGTWTTPFVAWASGVSTFTFSSLNQNACTAGTPCPAVAQSPSGLTTPATSTSTILNTYLLLLLAPLTFLVAFVTLGIWGGLMKHPVLLYVGLGAIVVTFIEFFLL